MSKRVQVPLSDEAFRVLKGIARDRQDNANNQKIGIGTIAAEVMNRMVINHPDWLSSLLSEGVVAESKADYEVAPKKADAQPQRANAAKKSG